MAGQYRVAVIGAGKPRTEEGHTGFGMAHMHVHGFLETKRCELVAVADIQQTNAEDFAARHGGTAQVFADYREMLAAAKPDIVSVCTWPHLHAPMVLDAIAAGARAVHCEKPMASTWGEARAMHRAAVEKGVQLTFNHQRRFLEPFRLARDIVRDGLIGELRRIEGCCADMIDWGTHWLDMFFFYNEETPAAWVLGQIDSREEKKIFGLPVENQGLCQVKFENGVRGLLFTGYDSDIGCANRLMGTDGVLEVHNQAPHVRVKGVVHKEWRTYETLEGIHGNAAFDRAAADVVRSLDTGEEPELSSHKAIRATEVIFATYESSRRRGRVDLPLTTEESAFLAMLEAGVIGPNRRAGM
jgi:UDP-N-acetylglucosamine 3-dehydrogenase